MRSLIRQAGWLALGLLTACGVPDPSGDALNRVARDRTNPQKTPPICLANGEDSKMCLYFRLWENAGFPRVGTPEGDSKFILEVCNPLRHQFQEAEHSECGDARERDWQRIQASRNQGPALYRLGPVQIYMYRP